MMENYRNLSNTSNEFRVTARKQSSESQECAGKYMTGMSDCHQHRRNSKGEGYYRYTKGWVGLLRIITGLLMAVSIFALAEKKKLHIYNWSNYIAPNTIADFEQETNIKIIYDLFDSNEVLDGKLMAGSTGFDLVVPAASFFERQLEAKVFQPLDKKALPNYKNLDPELLKLVANYDPNNQFAIPYLWNTTGIGYNVEKVKQVLGDDAPNNSWDLVLKAENLAKLKNCGVSFLDAPSEIFATILHYLGKDANSQLASDYTGSTTELLLTLRPSIRYFHSSQYINDLANGDICVAVGWNGDIVQAAKRAKEANNGINISYSIPKEGALVTFDVFAMPADAKHPQEAYQFLNYLMRPDVIANISDHVYYANANQQATQLIKSEVRYHPGIYPQADIRANMFTLKLHTAKLDRIITRAWTRVKSGK